MEHFLHYVAEQSRISLAVAKQGTGEHAVQLFADGSPIRVVGGVPASRYSISAMHLGIGRSKSARRACHHGTSAAYPQ
jgi:hypothetical protein